MKGKNKLIVEILEGKGRPIDAVQLAKLSSEIGIISRQFISIPTKWKDMKDNDKLYTLERLKSKFEMKLDDGYVKRYVISITSKLSRNHPHKVHLNFKKFPNDVVACQNKPTKYNLTQENWEQLCDLFSDPEYQCKDDEEPNRMNYFKATHYSNEKGWTTSEAQAKYEKIVELQSTPVEEGAEPKNINDIMDELKESLKNKEDELNDYKLNFELIQTQMEAMRYALLAVGMQVSSLQFSGSIIGGGVVELPFKVVNDIVQDVGSMMVPCDDVSVKGKGVVQSKGVVQDMVSSCAREVIIVTRGVRSNRFGVLASASGKDEPHKERDLVLYYANGLAEGY
ncbi:hypothetical protein F3Y22_tig00111810pilonHSYRG00280 [Hibiscus syriacus]|uniref:Uncharacterized protein n=1 Tax=Hibiscus syriacus TaxID=106335 RepID=A0A6A2YGF1_HIBSY|nr:hypothetical protein F3Y22_tig00111810pilonHSYRG00280 [Hibiscus syriacus]